MTMLRDYVLSLDDEEKILIINGHDKLEQTGTIGNDPIRLHVDAFFQKHDLPPQNTILWMEMIALECHRYFSEKYRNTKRDNRTWQD